jgi:flagellar biosynthesis protein FlhB
MLYAMVAVLPVVVIDWFLTHKIFVTENMMAKHEVEREHKETEGNPEIKSHRRQMANEIVNGPDRLPNASAVIRNPTHVAVVVRYEPHISPMPYVMEMAKDGAALAIIERAKQLNVPLYTNIPLARGVYANGAANSHVPIEYSEAIVSFVYWLKQNHPERIYEQTEFADILTRIGDVKR